MRISRLFGAVLTLVVPTASLAAQTTYSNADFGLRSGAIQYLSVLSPSIVPFYSFFYNIAGPIDRTTPTLLSSRAYQIRISGRAGVGPLDGSNYQNSMPDAAFAYCGFFQNIDTCQSPLSTDKWVAGWDGVDGRRPAVDVYNPNHVYDYFVAGLDAGLRFRFTDYPYSDNGGGFQIDISELGELSDPSVVPEPSGNLLMLAGLAGLLIAHRRARRRSRTDTAQ